MMFVDFKRRIENLTEGFISFKVTRNVDPEFYALMRIEGATHFQIKYRFVNVPVEELKEVVEIEELLELIFKYGQNDFQPVEMSPSLYPGDTIHFFDRMYKVCSVGFERIN